MKNIVLGIIILTDDNPLTFGTGMMLLFFGVITFIAGLLFRLLIKVYLANSINLALVENIVENQIDKKIDAILRELTKLNVSEFDKKK